MPVLYHYTNIRGMFGFPIRGEISTLATVADFNITACNVNCGVRKSYFTDYIVIFTVYIYG